MPRCSGCGNEFPATARFCAICGKQAIGATPTNPPPAAGYGQPPYGAPAVAQAAGPDKTKVILTAAVIVLLLAVAGFAMERFGVLGAKPSETVATPILNAPPVQAEPAPVLNAPPVQPPTAPVIQPPTQAGNPMPDDVIAYLRWLKQFEAARHDLEARSEGQIRVVLMETVKSGMTGGANSGLLDGDPTENSAAAPPGKPKSAFDFHVIDQIIGQWNQVAGLFQQRTPPNPCGQLAMSYNGALTGGVRQMSNLMGLLRSTLTKLNNNNGEASPDIMSTVSDLQAANNSKSVSKTVDTQFSDANTNLDNLRSRYTSIPDDISASQFSISESGGGGSGVGLGLGL